MNGIGVREPLPAPAEPGTIASPRHPLRERKKLRTRQALIDAALDLFERQGFAATTVEEIVAAVGVSRRTFSRYFAAKEDVVVSFEEERYEEVVVALAERPTGEPAMLALRNSILTAVGSHLREEPDRERFERVQRLLATTPALLAYSLERQRAIEEKVTAVLADRLDPDPGNVPDIGRGAGPDAPASTHLTARLAVSLAHNAARVAIDVCRRTYGCVAAEEYAATVRTVFTAMGRDIDFVAASDAAVTPESGTPPCP